MAKRHFLHVEKKEHPKCCRKGMKIQPQQDQQSPESSQAALASLPFCELIERGLHHVQFTAVGFLMYKCVELRQDEHKASSGYQDELCSVSLSKCISSPNYMEKFPELSAKQGSPTPAT